METSQQKLAGLLAEALAESTTVDACIKHLVTFAVESVGTEFGGITLIHHGGRRFETLGATHPAVERADRLQYDLREGPCVDASMQAKSLSSSELATDARWPHWGPRAAALGFRSIISAELQSRGQRIGAIHLYGADTRTFTHEDVQTVKMFAHQGSLALGFVKMEQTLGQAIEGRTLIGQAQGILMERFGIGADQAFAVLRRYSQGHNVKVQEIAARVVEHRSISGIADPSSDDHLGVGPRAPA